MSEPDTFTGPREGPTIRAHVDGLMQRAETTMAEQFAAIRGATKRLRPKERDSVMRRLSGVQGTLEDICSWLRAGAPQ